MHEHEPAFLELLASMETTITVAASSLDLSRWLLAANGSGQQLSADDHKEALAIVDRRERHLDNLRGVVTAYKAMLQVST